MKSLSATILECTEKGFEVTFAYDPRAAVLVRVTEIFDGKYRSNTKMIDRKVFALSSMKSDDLISNHIMQAYKELESQR
jgi:hypothetical protein